MGTTPLSPQLWLVETPAQAAQLQQSLTDEVTHLSQLGVNAPSVAVMPVATADQVEVLLNDLNTANLTREAVGLPPIVVSNLR